MDANSMNKEEENQYFSSVLKLKAIELENKLSLEKQRYILLQSELESSMSIASKHLDLYKNECTSLREKLSALENDYNLLKEKELKSQETIKNLSKKIERVDEERGSESQKNCENLKKNDNEVSKVKDAHDNAKEKEAENTRVFVDLDSDSEDGVKHSTELESHDSVKYNQNQREKKIPKLADRSLSLTVSDNKLQTSRKRSFCRYREYNGRPADDEQRLDAMIRARKIQRNLTPRNPSFIRSMARSHVSGSFWLTLNPEFCHKHLGKSTYNLILQDEKGSEFEVKYLGHVSALSGGWAGFAKAHKLELYDAVLFELCKPTKFKVHIIKANLKPFDDSQDKLAATERLEDQDIDLSDISMNFIKMNKRIKYGRS